MSGNRQSLAEKLNEHVPGNEPAKALATETPPDGEFPVLILTDRDQGGAGVHFFYRAAPEIPAGILPTGILCEGHVSHITQRFMPQPVLEFKLRGNLLTFVADSRFRRSVNIGDRVYAACRLDAEAKAAVVDMLHCGPNGTIAQDDKNAFHARLQEAFQPPDDV